MMMGGSLLDQGLDMKRDEEQAGSKRKNEIDEGDSDDNHEKEGGEKKRKKVWRVMLTPDQAKEIYKCRPALDELHGKCVYTHGSMRNARIVAKDYNVSAKTIRDIWNRYSWAKVTRPLWTEQETMHYSTTYPIRGHQGMAIISDLSNNLNGLLDQFQHNSPHIGADSANNMSIPNMQIGSSERTSSSNFSQGNLFSQNQVFSHGQHPSQSNFGGNTQSHFGGNTQGFQQNQHFSQANFSPIPASRDDLCMAGERTIRLNAEVDHIFQNPMGSATIPYSQQRALKQAECGLDFGGMIGFNSGSYMNNYYKDVCDILPQQNGVNLNSNVQQPSNAMHQMLTLQAQHHGISGKTSASPMGQQSATQRTASGAASPTNGGHNTSLQMQIDQAQRRLNQLLMLNNQGQLYPDQPQSGSSNNFQSSSVKGYQSYQNNASMQQPMGGGMCFQG